MNLLLKSLKKSFLAVAGKSTYNMALSTVYILIYKSKDLVDQIQQQQNVPEDTINLRKKLQSMSTVFQ